MSSSGQAAWLHVHTRKSVDESWYQALHGETIGVGWTFSDLLFRLSRFIYSDKYLVTCQALLFKMESLVKCPGLLPFLPVFVCLPPTPRGTIHSIISQKGLSRKVSLKLITVYISRSSAVIWNGPMCNNVDRITWSLLLYLGKVSFFFFIFY